MPGKSHQRVASSHDVMKDVDMEKDLAIPPAENFGPPSWRTVLNKRVDLGYPDFYPSRPGFGQTEDILTEENVKNGFSAKPLVTPGAESFSMRGPIHNHLLNGCLNLLNKLGEDMVSFRDDGMPQVGERAFRIPVRVTYNDAKRTQFLADLANPAIPLYRLMRSPIPHGFKGLDLFETMFSPPPLISSRIVSGTATTPTKSTTPGEPIPLDRALWFIRVLGSNEISTHRGRAQTTSVVMSAPSPAAAATPSSTTTTGPGPSMPLSSNEWYTQEFTSLYINWLRVQLSQLVLPPSKGAESSAASVPNRPGSGILGDDAARSRWGKKWDYSSKLLLEMHMKNLVSSRLLCGWIADTLGTSNLAQLGFVTRMSGDYIQSFHRHTAIARPAVQASLDRLQEIRSSPMAATLVKTETMLKDFIKALYSADPEVVLSPTMWRDHTELITDVLLPHGEHTGIGDSSDARVNSLNRQQKRSRAMIFRPPSTENMSTPRRQRMEDYYKLDSMNAETDMPKLCRSFFDGSTAPTAPSIDLARFDQRVFLLLDWAMGSLQLGIHRAYSAFTLLMLWQEQFKEHQSRSARPITVDVFATLFRWLDSSEAAKSEANVTAIGITFVGLTWWRLFSIERYLQTLIARGYSARSSMNATMPSHHLRFVRTFAVFSDAKDLLRQRDLVLYGDDLEAKRAGEEEDRQMVQAFQEDLLEYVPEVFGYKRYGRSASFRDLVNHQLPSTSRMTRYLYVKTRDWFYPLAVAALSRQGRRPAMDASTFARILHVFRQINAFNAIPDFLGKALKVTDDEDILDIILDAIRRDADIWTAVYEWAAFVEALLERNRLQDERQKHHAGLCALLLELSLIGRLSKEQTQSLEASIKEHRKSLNRSRVGYWDAKESMGELEEAITNGDVSGAIALGTKMFTRHGPFENWSVTWWQTIVRAGAVTKRKGHALIADTIVAHVEVVNAQTDDSLDPVVGQWLDIYCPLEAISVLSRKGAHQTCALLLELCARGLTHVVPQILERAVFPTWKHFGTLSLEKKSTVNQDDLHAMEHCLVLAQQLLLTDPAHPELPPRNLRQALIIQTERSKVFDAFHIPHLIRHLPFLVVLQTSPKIPDRLREAIRDFLHSLAMTPPFKAASLRQLDLLKDAFLSNEWSKPGTDSSIEAGMVDTLKLIMSQNRMTSVRNGDDPAAVDTESRSTAWRWTSTVLGMRVDLKRLAMRIQNEQDAEEARADLQRLLHSSFDRTMTADEADLLWEAFRGVELVIAQEVIAIGTDRLKAFLAEVIGAETQIQLEVACQSIDLMLRVVDSAMRSTTVPWSDMSILTARHALLDLISVALQSIERRLATDDEVSLPPEVQPTKPADMLHAVLRLLRFALTLKVVDSASPAAPKPDFGRLAISYLKVLLVLPQMNAATSTRLVDMLTYIIDSCPPASRYATHNAILMEAVAALPGESGKMSLDVARALPQMSPNRRPMALRGASSLTDEEYSATPLDDRPWEMLEQLIPPNDRPLNQDIFLASNPVKDTTSIPLYLFNPRVESDSVPLSEITPPETPRDIDRAALYDETPTTFETYASERNLGNGLSGEEDMAKQMATALFAGPEASIEDDIIIHRNPSSAAPRIRRASTRLMSKSGNMLPGSGSNQDPIVMEVDEEEVGAEPRGKRPKVGSKTTGGKTVRKSTGGKTTGKSVGRKNTGGKSVRGKMPKTTTRKRSNAD